MKRRACRTCLDLAAAAALLGLAACAGDTNPIRDVALSTGISTAPAPRADFVEKTRPESLDYNPIGNTPPARARTAKTADEVRAAEAEMDQARTENESKAASARQLGATPAPTPGIPARNP